MTRNLDMAQAVGLLESASDIHALHGALGVLLGPQPTSDQLVVASATLGQPRVLGPIIDSALADPNLLAELDQRSYQLVGSDADGNDIETFHSVVLAREEDPDGEILWDSQLHLWFPEQAIMDDTHNHGPDFASTSLTDEPFRDIVYVPCDRGTAMLVYGDLTDEPTGEARLRALPERVLPKGNTQVIDHMVVHEATLTPRGIAATLTVRGKRHREYGEVFSPTPREGSGPQQVGIPTAESLERFRRIFP